MALPTTKVRVKMAPTLEFWHLKRAWHLISPFHSWLCHLCQEFRKPEIDMFDVCVFNVAPTSYHAKPLKCQAGGCAIAPSIPTVFCWISWGSRLFSCVLRWIAAAFGGCAIYSFGVLVDFLQILQFQQFVVGLGTLFWDCGNVLRWLAAPFGVVPSIPAFLGFGWVCMFSTAFW